VLTTEKKFLNVYESPVSLSYHSHSEWEPSWINGGFIGLLKCSNTKCAEIVSIIGKMNVIEGHEYNEELDRMDYIGHQMLTPLQFYPTLNIFLINKDVPNKISDVILSAFSLYWVDLSSCANKIRVVAELIMDDKKVPKKYIIKKKRYGYSLHQRIEFFKKTNSEEADLLMAIKWIGNSGSHEIYNITSDDILDGFEILELVTTKLYETDSKRIKTLSRNINKRRKPISKKIKTKRKHP